MRHHLPVDWETQQNRYTSDAAHKTATLHTRFNRIVLFIQLSCISINRPFHVNSGEDIKSLLNRDQWSSDLQEACHRNRLINHPKCPVVEVCFPRSAPCSPFAKTHAYMREGLYKGNIRVASHMNCITPSLVLRVLIPLPWSMFVISSPLRLRIHKFIKLVMHIEGYNVRVSQIFVSVSCFRMHVPSIS